VATFNLNLQSLGYTLSADALKAILCLNEVSATLVFDEVLSCLKEIKGVRNYKPMYPNFPKQVIEASDAELYINAMIHYFSFMLVDLTGDPDKIWLPKYVKDKREPLDEKIELRVLGLATTEDVDKLTTRLATSNTSLSASDKEELRLLIMVGGYGNMLEILPAVPNKENLAFLGAMLFGTAIDLAPYFKTATDVLRLATALSNGDVSLKDDSKFRSFKGSERRFLLSLLEKIDNKEEDMVRFPARWVRLGERLHPGDYAKRFPTTLKAFTVVRNNEHVETFRTHVEVAVRAGNAIQATTLLTQRPGEFARRLDHVLRGAGTKVKQDRVVGAFLGVAQDVSTPVLLQVLAHFEHRDDLRVVFPKGNVAKVTSLEDKPLSELPKSTISYLVSGIQSVLVERFAALPALGKVYIDPQLKDVLLPFSQRSASKTLRTLVRGSKLSFGDEKGTVRFFIWWKEGKNGKVNSDLEENFYGYHSDRVDLDLSACAYDENWVSKGAVTYYNLRQQFAVHSGDITSAPKGASEFIDVDIAKALKAGVRYIVQTVHSFTGQKFSDVPECFAGFMLRDKLQSGEVYDPRTVVDRADVTTEATSVVPMILDLVDRKVIWVDAAMTTKGSRDYRYDWRRGGNDVASTRGTIELLGKAFTNIHKPTLFDLLSLHVEARGTLVETQDEADVVFSVEAGTPFELDRIASEFMADGVKPTKTNTAVA
jgi:stress response protein SCP2